MACNSESVCDLHTACLLGDLVACQNIITRFGTNVIYRQNLEGWTPLMMSVRFNHIQIVEFILSFSNENYLKIKTHIGLDALMIGASNGHEESIILLLNKNISLLDETDFSGRDALFYAVYMKQDSCIRILLEYKTFYTNYKSQKSIKEESKALSSTKTCGNEFKQEPLLLRIFKDINLEKYWQNFEMLKIDFDTFIKMNEEDLIRVGIRIFEPISGYLVALIPKMLSVLLHHF